jgi:hypothetical protein
MQKPDPMAHGPLHSPQVEEHLRAISDHLGAILWEHALTIVRAAESGDTQAEADARASARRTADTLGDRMVDETDRMVSGLSALLRRSTGQPEPPRPVPTEDPVPEESHGPGRRASLHDSPLTDLFHRTD